jgi:hypothetical protein
MVEYLGGSLEKRHGRGGYSLGEIGRRNWTRRALRVDLGIDRVHREGVVVQSYRRHHGSSSSSGRTLSLSNGHNKSERLGDRTLSMCCSAMAASCSCSPLMFLVERVLESRPRTTNGSDDESNELLRRLVCSMPVEIVANIFGYVFPRLFTLTAWPHDVQTTMNLFLVPGGGRNVGAVDNLCANLLAGRTDPNPMSLVRRLLRLTWRRGGGGKTRRRLPFLNTKEKRQIMFAIRGVHVNSREQCIPPITAKNWRYFDWVFGSDYPAGSSQAPRGRRLKEFQTWLVAYTGTCHGCAKFVVDCMRCDRQEEEDRHRSWLHSAISTGSNLPYVLHVIRRDCTCSK